MHTLDLPEGNRTADQAVCAYADAREAAVVTKDVDFVIQRTLSGRPRRLLVIATGNISNSLLLQFIETHLPAISSHFVAEAYLELTRQSLIIHD